MINSIKLHNEILSIGLASMFHWPPGPRGESGSFRDGGLRMIGESEEVGENNHNIHGGESGSVSNAFHLHGLGGSETMIKQQQGLLHNNNKSSFTIDSLLGTAASAAQVATQHPHHHHQRIMSPHPHPYLHHHHHHHSRPLLYHHQHDCEGQGQERDGEEDSKGTKAALTKSLWPTTNDSGKHRRQERKESRASLNSSKKERNNHSYPGPSTVQEKTSKSQKLSRRGAKSKRVRTIFTPEQLERLESEFERQQYMVGPERLYLASSLFLVEAQVKVWFQNRRIKWRKQHLELQQQRLAISRNNNSNSNGSHGGDGDNNVMDNSYCDEDAFDRYESDYEASSSKYPESKPLLPLLRLPSNSNNNNPHIVPSFPEGLFLRGGGGMSTEFDQLETAETRNRSNNNKQMCRERERSLSPRSFTLFTSPTEGRPSHHNSNTQDRDNNDEDDNTEQDNVSSHWTQTHSQLPPSSSSSSSSSQSSVHTYSSLH